MDDEKIIRNIGNLIAFSLVPFSLVVWFQYDEIIFSKNSFLFDQMILIVCIFGFIMFLERNKYKDRLDSLEQVIEENNIPIYRDDNISFEYDEHKVSDRCDEYIEIENSSEEDADVTVKL